MQDEPGSPSDDREIADLMLRMAEAMLSRPSSDARAGLGSLVREIESRKPGFIAQLNAVNDAQRLGLPVVVATAH